MIWNEDSGDVQKFCTTLMEKTVGEIGILNSDLFSDQFFTVYDSVLEIKRLHSFISGNT